MTDETLNITLSNLRDDLDMLLNAHYSTSEDGIAGMKERIASIVANIDTLTTGLSETNTKLAQDETTLNTCVEHDAFYDQNIAPLVDQNNTKLSSLWVDFRTFLDYFLKLQEKNDTVELYEKINLWMPYLMKLRKILDILDADDAQSLKDMLENGSTGGGTVNEELETQVNQNTANITALQGRVTTLEDQVAKYLTPPDPYYTGKSFTDYPAGTIIQTYDYDERVIDWSYYIPVNTTTIEFFAEQSSTATIKLTYKFKLLDDTQKVLVTTKLNDTQIDSIITEDITKNTEYTFERTLYDIPLNTESKFNSIYSTLTHESGINTNTTQFISQKVEIIASNVDIINKIQPYDVICVDGKYYLTDTSSQVLKTAEIECSQLHNMDNLTWVTTDTTSVESKIGFSSQFFNNTYILDKVVYSTLSKKNEFNLIYYNDANELKTRAMANIKNLCFASYGNKYATVLIRDNGNNFSYRYLDTSNNNTFYNSSFRLDFCKVCALQRQLDQYRASCPIISATIMKTGNCVIRVGTTSNSPTLDLGYGTDATFFLTQENSNTKFTFDVFVKKFDKIVKYNISYENKVYTVNSTTEIGSYSKYMQMPDDYYFVIKNGVLSYHIKKETD